MMTRGAFQFNHTAFTAACRQSVARRNQMVRQKPISLRDVSAETGVSHEMLYAMSKGENISMRLYLKICNALELNPCDYFTTIADGGGEIGG